MRFALSIIACPFYFGYCVVSCISLFVLLSFFFWSLCEMSFFDFGPWLLLWYLQTLLCPFLAIELSVLRLMDSDFPFVIFKLFFPYAGLSHTLSSWSNKFVPNTLRQGGNEVVNELIVMTYNQTIMRLSTREHLWGWPKKLYKK